MSSDTSIIMVPIRSFIPSYAPGQPVETGKRKTVKNAFSFLRDSIKACVCLASHNIWDT